VRYLLAATLFLSLAAAYSGLSQSVATPRGGRHDAQIEKRLAAFLKDKAEYKDVRFAVEDSVITLQGSVNLASERNALVWKATHIEHVASVQDFIYLSPAPVSDEALRGALQRTIEALHIVSLKFTAHEGRVRLSGDIANRREWSRAIQAVWAMPGVREVEDATRIIGE